jgi:glyoxylase-like metal-dependent hydrolase (beta-lactamase superfamily II)/rhodanese-related sulfurtransferase
MALTAYSAEELFSWLTTRPDFLLLDVRNNEEFGRFKVEGPYPINMINVPYVEFIEHEAASVAKVPTGNTVRIVCAKEGSAKYVGEILMNHGFEDVGYLKEGIKSWGNLLASVEIAKGDNYRLFQFIRPGKASCSYSLVCENEMMVFDPAKNIDAYLRFAEQQNAKIIKTFETHRQADYISGSWPIQRAVGAAIMAPDPDFSVARFEYTPVNDGDVHTFTSGGPSVKVIHTPGHTPGSTSYLIDDRYLITGDTVFILSIGRPDLGGQAEAWSRMLFKTMKDIIIPMNEETLILPGHYMDWSEANHDHAFVASMGEIKKKNADIYQIDNEADFYQFIKSNMRKQPDEYAKIREINAGLEEPEMEQQDILDLGKNECAASVMGHG